MGQDDPRSTVVRYTQKQRLRDLRSRQFADEAAREKPYDVTAAEEDLAYAMRSQFIHRIRYVHQ